MSQDGVIKLLSRAKKPLSNKEIANRLKITDSTANANLNRLLKQFPSPIKFTFSKLLLKKYMKMYSIRGNVVITK